jgi:hypothetical protein
MADTTLLFVILDAYRHDEHTGSLVKHVGGTMRSTTSRSTHASRFVKAVY